MARYRLYGFGQSGNAYKAALMLNLCGLDWEPVPVDYFNGETRTPAWRETVNAMGEVPALVGDGVNLSQSGAILTWLSEKTGKFGPRNEAERYEILRWILFDNHKFTSYIATLRFMVALAKTGENDVTALFRQRADGAVAIVEKHLTGRDFLVGDRPTIADLSLCGYLYFPEQYGVDWPAQKAISAWLGRIAALPGWKPPYDMQAPAPAARA